MSEQDYIEHDYSNLVPDWNYEEFDNLQQINEPRTKYARGYVVGKSEFYIEPWFYTQLTRLFERFPERKDDLVEKLLLIANSYPKVLFTRDITDPVFHDDDYILVEIEQIVNGLGIVFDDISRGSDYGD